MKPTSFAKDANLSEGAQLLERSKIALRSDISEITRAKEQYNSAMASSAGDAIFATIGTSLTTGLSIGTILNAAGGAIAFDLLFGDFLSGRVKEHKYQRNWVFYWTDTDDVDVAYAGYVQFAKLIAADLQGKKTDYWDYKKNKRIPTTFSGKVHSSPPFLSWFSVSLLGDDRNQTVGEINAKEYDTITEGLMGNDDKEHNGDYFYISADNKTEAYEAVLEASKAVPEVLIYQGFSINKKDGSCTGGFFITKGIIVPVTEFGCTMPAYIEPHIVSATP